METHFLWKRDLYCEVVWVDELDLLLFYFSATYYPIYKRCMEPQDFDLVTDLFSNSTLRRLGRRKQNVLKTNSSDKERVDWLCYNLGRKKPNQMNSYEGPGKFCDTFNRIEPMGNAFRARNIGTGILNPWFAWVFKRFAREYVNQRAATIIQNISLIAWRMRATSVAKTYFATKDIKKISGESCYL